ncbi:MAG: ATP-binding protein [Labilithrix sp.]
MHTVLQRQLRKLGLTESTPPGAQAWGELLRGVDRAYQGADEDRYTLERSIELSSAEMTELHTRLACERDTLRAIFDSADVGILRIDPLGHILEANEAMNAMVGVSPGALEDQELSTLTLDGAPWLVEGSSSASVQAPPRERELRHAGGSAVWVRTTCSWVYDKGGEPSFATVVVQNVTATKHLEVSLRHAQKLESVGLLASGIAHEINTPIQFVNDNVHFLRSAFDDVLALLLEQTALVRESAPALEPKLGEIADGADLPYLKSEAPRAFGQTIEGLKRVAKIVQAMKDFAHPVRGEQSYIDVNAGLESTITVATHEIKTVARVSLELGDIPNIRCYPSDLNQVFLNILVNAAQAIADVVEGTGQLGTITVHTRLDGDFVVIAISDTGGGIPEAAQARIFEPFFTTKPIGRGTGQGLALARALIVEKHGGEIWFESELGQGTTFYLRLPIDGRAPASRHSSRGQ